MGKISKASALIMQGLIEQTMQKQFIWRKLFAHMNMDEDKMELPITDEEFKNPYCPTVKSIFFLYSLESFIYKQLNYAARTK